MYMIAYLHGQFNSEGFIMTLDFRIPERLLIGQILDYNYYSFFLFLFIVKFPIKLYRKGTMTRKKKLIRIFMLSLCG